MDPTLLERQIADGDVVKSPRCSFYQQKQTLQKGYPNDYQNSKWHWR
jgi:hypothetical protein